MKRKINKPILLSALALTQGAGAVMLVQNSIVQAYAEQKNKEVTSQEFLDYINQLKEQNPDFKFSQGEIKVFESEEQALANLAEQKQAINTAIANYKQAVADRERAYEEAKANVKAQNEQIKQSNEQAEQDYQNQLNAYNAKRAEIAQWTQANPVITELDNGIKLRGRYDESKKNSIHYFDDIAIDASNELLETGEYNDGSLRCYIWFRLLRDGSFEIVRQVLRMPYISMDDISDYTAVRRIETVEDLNKAFENIFNLPQRLLDLFSEF